MQLTSPERVIPVDAGTQALTFEGQRGERFRVVALDDDLVRVSFWPDGQPRLDRTWLVVGAEGDVPLEGRPRDDFAPFPLPAPEVTSTEDVIELRTAQLRLRVFTGDFRLAWLDGAGRLFAADIPRRAYVYDRRGQAVFHYMQRRRADHFYGFGEVSGRLDKSGRRLRMAGADALGYNAETSSPLYKHFPFYITLVPELNLAYGLFYDNLAPTVFDMGQEINALRGGLYRYYQAQGGDVDYYLLFGPTIEAVVEKFTALTGRPALPPRWSLGFLGSTMSYTEAPDAQQQLKRFVDLCDEHDIPCDMFHLSSGYTTDEAGRRCVFTWNRRRIPQPRQMVDHFHGAGIRLAANIKPYLLKAHPRYAELAEQGGFVKASDSDQPEINLFWSGGVFEQAEGSYVDFTSPAGYAWWKFRVTDALLAYGIDAMWNDNNEFEVWDDEARCDGFGNPIPARLARPLLTLLMARASFEATQEYRPDERPFLLTRSGCPGIQRYAQTWSGDNATSWHTLRYNIPMGLGLSLSGMPNTGHDVGGFDGPKPDPELFVRWVQNGIFHPRFTIHSFNSDGTVNEPWMYPEVLPIIREAISFRYRLLPYLYTLFCEAARTGQPIIRPMVYHFPHDVRCRTESFDFMLGPNLLVASVLEPGTRAREVYLPSGVQWCDFYTGQWYDGGQIVTLDAPLERIPLLVPAGGIIPMGKRMRHVGAEPDNVRRVCVFPAPGDGRGAFTLIEDDGLSLAYQRGAYTEVICETLAEPDRLTLAIELAHQGYVLPYQAVELVLPSGEARPVQGPDGSQACTETGGRRVVRVPLV